MTFRRLFALFLAVVIVVAGVVAWTSYRRIRADYDAYRGLIQAGIHVSGVPVGGLTPEEARARVTEQVAEPYYREFALSYLDENITLSPGTDLGLEIPVDQMVKEAVAASHHYDYWEGFKLWIQGKTIPLEMDVPLALSFGGSPETGGRGRGI
jgi:hypothetical protein